MKKILCMMMTLVLLLSATVAVIPVSADDSAAVTDYQAPVFYGVQFADSAVEGCKDIRFVSVVPNGNGTVLGYEIYAKFNDGSEKYIEYSTTKGETGMESNTVYDSLVAGGFSEITKETAAAHEKVNVSNPYGLLALAVKGVPTNIGDIRFYVRTYVKDGDEVKAENIVIGFVVSVSGETATEISASSEWYNQGGIGTEAYPYVLTQANFDAFYKHYIWSGAYNEFKTGEYFSLETDVVIPASNGTVLPMNTFKGSFNGNGRTISGLNVQSAGHAGLFVIIEGGTVENLRLVDCIFTNTAGSYNRAGAITGTLLGGTIRNCYVDAIVTTTTDSSAPNVALGGIVGMMNKGGADLVDNCVFNGTVSGQYCVAGGIVGKVNGGAWSEYIQRCTNKGTVTGSVAGSILGKTEADYTQIICCVNEGSVSGTTGTVAGDHREIGDVGGRTNYRISSDAQYLKQ